jgi:hypothetical protein
MKIIIINQYSGSPIFGMEFRPYYLASKWVELGHDVHIVTGSFSHLRQKNPVVTAKRQVDVIDGISYHWIRTITYFGNGTRRAVNMMEFGLKVALMASSLAKQIDPDVIITSSTHPFDEWAGERLRRITRRRRRWPDYGPADRAKI